MTGMRDMTSMTNMTRSGTNKLMYKKTKESLLDTPPILSKLGNIDKRAFGPEHYDYRGYPFDPHGTYYVVPSSRMPGYNPYHAPHNNAYNNAYNNSYYGENASPVVMKLDRKYIKDRYHQFYPPIFRLPPVGTCPGCGGKTPLIPSRTPAKNPHNAHELEPDFLERISPSAFTPLRSKHNSDSKNSSREMMYPHLLSPSQALNNKDPADDFKSKDDKLVFSISAEKTPHRRSPTLNNKELKYSASGAKLYKEDIADQDLNSNLFSHDLVDDENTKSPFSFLKKSSLAFNGRNREAFNNITNTINKSQVKEEPQKRNTEALAPKALNFELKRPQTSANQS